MTTYQCHRCGTSLRAVALLDLEQEGPVYCGPCTKLLEREQLHSWAASWAKSLAPGQEEQFFTVLAAVWEQGFTRARTFEESRTVYDLEDNPFQASPDPSPVEQGEAMLDEDEYYDRNPVFGRP